MSVRRNERQAACRVGSRALGVEGVALIAGC